jgi:hypothetical protein
MKRAFALSSIVVLTAGCGSSVGTAYSLDVGADDAGNVTLVTGDAGASQALDAYIEQGQVAVKLITLSCAGDCATVRAVGTGGFPPYSFAWEDGSTNPVREVCPTADTNYAVKVTDTGETGEVPRPSQTARASVTADVLACPDAGGADAGAADSGVSRCVQVPLTSAMALACYTDAGSIFTGFDLPYDLQPGAAYSWVLGGVGGSGVLELDGFSSSTCDHAPIGSIDLAAGTQQTVCLSPHSVVSRIGYSSLWFVTTVTLCEGCPGP